jgi:AraC family transcriptional regulator, transcriptional activator of pobA
MVTLQHFSTMMQMQGENIAGIYVCEVSAQKLSRAGIKSTYANFFSFFRVESGEATYAINSRRYTLTPGTVVTLSPRQLVFIERFSTDFRALYVSVEVSLLEKILTHSVECKVLADRLITGHLPIIDEADSHSTLAGQTMQLMQNLQLTRGIGVRDPVQTNLLKNLMSIVSDALLGCGQPAGICHQEVIYRQFIALVATQYTCEHSTRFYAEKLCVTPVYLARIVRRYSEKTVKEFILSLVYHDAMDMLRYTDKPVGDIARNLGFPDIESFSKFFKKRNGQPPSIVQRMP